MKRWIGISLLLSASWLWCAQGVAQIPSELPRPTFPVVQPGWGPVPRVPQPQAPPTGGFIEGINYDDNKDNNTGIAYIPPDPMGAVGPNHLVSVVNSSIEWHTKAGTQQYSASLATFFSSLSPATQVFDPKVIYDQHEGRFLVVVLERDNASATSRILLAVSDDSDPNGTWYYLAIDAKTTIGSVDCWADYPGFAVDEEAVYITANMFPFGGTAMQGERLWIVAKAGFYSNGSAIVNQYDPLTKVGAGYLLTLQPAHVFGAAPSNVGTFLVGYGGLSDGTNESLLVIRVDNPLSSSPSFVAQKISLGDIDDTSAGSPFQAPQLGSGETIDAGDRRTLHAVWRDNALWVTTTIVPGSGANAGQATAYWVEVNTTNLSSLSVSDQGEIGGEDIASGTHTFYPSVAVDSAGNVGFGFAASGSSIYPGAYYTGRASTDAAGTVQSTETLAAGEDYYVRTFGRGRNRWGDYSGIALDPSDDKTFWVFNEYAMQRGTLMSGEDGRWATRWGNFSFQTVVTVAKTGDYIQAVSPGATNVPFLQLGMVTDTAAATLTGLQVAFTSSSTAQDADIALLKCVLDANGNGTYDSGEKLLGSATFNGGTATISGMSHTLNTTQQKLLLTLDIANDANPSHKVGLRLADSSAVTVSYGTVASTNFPIENASDSSLPVRLSTFVALTSEEGIQLQWRTESEVDNAGFQLYRARKGEEQGQPLTFLPGAGHSASPVEYTYLDAAAQIGETYVYSLEAIDLAGHRDSLHQVEITFLPWRSRLLPNYPNPFNPETWFPYELAEETRVRFRIFDAQGHRIREIDLGVQKAGVYHSREKAAHWDGRNDAGQSVASGVYFYQLLTDDFAAMRKMVVLR